MNTSKNIFKTIIRQFTRQPLQRKEPYRVNYHEAWLLPPLAVFIGLFFVLYAHPRSFGEAVFMPAFYKAAIPSALSAWVVMWVIVRVTYVLDAAHPWAIRWHRGPTVRMLLQLALGVAMPGFFLFGVFGMYFLVRGRADLIIRYALEDFPFALLLFVGFNALLWIYYRVRTVEIMDKYRRWGRDHSKTEAELEERWQQGRAGGVPDVEQARQWLAVLENYKKQNNSSWSTDMDGRTDIQDYTMTDFYRKCKGYHFFLVRKGTIVNRSAIRSIARLDGRIAVYLGKGRPDEEIMVSRNNTKEFAVWWQERPPAD